MASSQSGESPIQSLPTLVQLQKFFETSAEIITCISMTGDYVFVSGAVKNVLGYDPEELIGKTALDIVAEEDKEKIIAMGMLVRDGQTLTGIESRIIHKSGKLVDISWSIQLLPEEQVILGFGRDISEMRTLENERIESVKLVSNLLENISDGFYAVNNDWKITYFNGMAEKMLRRRREDVLNKNIWDEFPEAVKTQIYSVYNYAMSNKVSGVLDVFYKPLESWFRINYHPSPQGISFFFRDVTKNLEDEKQKQEYIQQIQLQNILLSNILENMQQGFINMDFQDIVYYWNKNAERITTRPASAMLGKPLKEGLDFCHDPNFMQLLKNAGEDTSDSSFEYYSQPLDLWMDFNVYKSLNGYSIFFKDISERKQTEQELQRLSLIAKETFNNVIITDSDGKITWVNNAFIRTTGYTLDEIRGIKPGNLLQGPESDINTILFMRRKLRREEPFHAEIINYTKRKEKIWMEIYCQPIFDAHGKLKEYFAIQSDITERKNLQKKIDQNQKEWQAKITEAVIKAQENERAVVSQELHDNVNQVLTTVKLYNELCIAGNDQSDQLMAKSVILLQESIAEIRKLSRRLSAPSLGSIKFEESIRDLVNTLSVASTINIKMETSGLQKLRIHPELHLSIYRILQEHLTNILKHSKASHAHILLTVIDKKIQLTITDNGIGFHVNDKRSGIGITNMIARAENMKGSLEIISAPKEGCVLKASFPLKLSRSLKNKNNSADRLGE